MVNLGNNGVHCGALEYQVGKITCDLGEENQFCPVWCS